MFNVEDILKTEGKKKITKKMVLSVILVLILIIIDQSFKLYILNNHIDDTVIIKDTLQIDYVENRGGAFGVGQNSTITFIITNVIVLGLIIRFIYIQKEEMDIKTLIMLLLILAGGISNLIDRLSFGFVVDYINLLPKVNFPRVNLADIYITLGWAAFLLTVAVRTIKDLIELKKADKNNMDKNNFRGEK